MCGIVGIFGSTKQDIIGDLLNSIKNLEYRGYDSAGIAAISLGSPELLLKKTVGKIQNLANAIAGDQNFKGFIGIAHTRWATHGEPSVINAHPQVINNELAVVHNGIIENYQDLKQKLITEGFFFSSETDTEVAAALIYLYWQQSKDLLTAVQRASIEFKGAYALAIVNILHPEELIALRCGSPLILGIAKNRHIVASDTVALPSDIKNVVYLEEGDVVKITSQEYQIFNNEVLVHRQLQPINIIDNKITKENFDHFMLKEIYDQPKAIADTLEGRIIENHVNTHIFGVHAEEIFKKIKSIKIVACGSSYHAGLIARYWLEEITRIPCDVEIASEFRYRKRAKQDNCLLVCVSQSGETADTLAALRNCVEGEFISTLSICNVASSSLVRETELAFITRAGVEVGVAATKTFSCQLLALSLLTLAIARSQNNTDDMQIQLLTNALKLLPASIDACLELKSKIQQVSEKLHTAEHIIFLGRGSMYPLACEGALKLKEISYIHTDAYAGGELKHGPLALVSNGMPVVVLMPQDENFDKMSSNIQEIKARGGIVYVLTDNEKMFDTGKELVINLPNLDKKLAFWLTPMLYIIPLQLLSYQVAVLNGTDIDQPRNLAKSVTVE